MLDVQRLDCVQCTTALEVQLLAALREAKRELGRLKQPAIKPPQPKFRPPKLQPAPEPETPRPRVLLAYNAGIKNIQLAVCKRFDVPYSEVVSCRRTHDVSRVRHVAVMLSHALTKHSYPFIGRFFGNRDHSTMLHSCAVMEDVRRQLLHELNQADPLETWVNRAYELVNKDRAKPPAESPDPAELVVDIKALREA
jgi:Bacterial dnaA protein helix-turn-helix